MNIKKIIALLYFAYTIYILLVVDSTSISFFNILPAIMILWITFFMFYAGYSVKTRHEASRTNNESNNEVWLFSGKKRKLVIIALLSVICSILVGRYYTGQTPITMVLNLKNNISLYAEYQSYFVEQQRAVLSIIKIPHILMMFYIQAVMFYSYCAIIVKKTKVKKSEVLYLFVITLAFIYFGIVRGTNFEFFEIGMMAIFVLLSKVSFTKNKKTIMTLIKVMLLVVVLISLYSLVLRLRGYTTFYTISKDVFYKPDGVMPLISPLISYLVIMLYGYFGHGFNYIAVYVNEIWISSFNHFIAGLLPFGHTSILGESLDEIVSKSLDMGVMWQPDNALIISSFGFIGLLIVPFLLGIISTYTDKKGQPLAYLMQFMILLQMLSMPVGHFVFTSSSNILILFLLIVYWFWKIVMKVRIRV